MNPYESPLELGTSVSMTERDLVHVALVIGNCVAMVYYLFNGNLLSAALSALVVAWIVWRNP